MKFDRAELQQHLSRIHVDGEITEAVVRPDLSCTAVTPDHALFLDVPAGIDEEGEELPEEIGVVDFNVLITILGHGRDDEVEIEMRDRRMVVHEDDDETSFLVATPDTVGTAVEDELREVMLEDIDQGPGAPIGARTAEQISRKQDALGSLEVKLECGPDGTDFIIGPESSHHHTHRKPDLTTEGLEEDEFTLILPANTMIRIFDLLPDPDEAEMALTGPGSVVGIAFDGHTYLLNPMDDTE